MQPDEPSLTGGRHANSQFGDAGIMGASLVEPVLDSWGDFVSEFAMDAAPAWLFRGQANFEWGLGTSLRRAFVGAGITDAVQRAHFENSSIGFFKDRARLHLPRQPDENDLLGWLALMQHYGAPTRLQDWTRSPFVAAYFAYRENPDPSLPSSCETASAVGLLSLRARTEVLSCLKLLELSSVSGQRMRPPMTAWEP